MKKELDWNLFKFILQYNHGYKIYLMIKILFQEKPVNFVEISTFCTSYVTSAAEMVFCFF